MMRDIMSRLAIHAQHQSVVSELEVIGISTSGLAVQLLHMSQPSGYVCLFHADSPLRVPAHIEQFPELGFVLALVLKMKVCSQTLVVND